MDRVLNSKWKMARMGRVQIKFGPALHLAGADYLAQARQVEAAVRKL
jgi:hypothetical protein